MLFTDAGDVALPLHVSGVLRLRPEFAAFKPRLVLSPQSKLRDARGYGLAITLQGGMSVRAGAFDFDGVDDYIDIGSGSLVNNVGHTLVAVTRLTSSPTNYNNVSQYLTSTGSKFLFYTTDAGYGDLSWGNGGSRPGGNQAKFAVSAIAPMVGAEHRLVLRTAGTASTDQQGWCNGSVLTRTNSSDFDASGGSSVIGVKASNDLIRFFPGEVRLFILFDGLLPDALCKAISADVSLLFEPDEFPFFTATATAAVAGQAASLGAFTGASSGLVAVSASGLASLAGVVPSAVGAVSLVGGASRALQAMGAAAVGASGIAASSAAMLQGVRPVASGVVGAAPAVAGQAASLGAFTGAASGFVAAAAAGSASLAAVAASGMAAVSVTASSAISIGTGAAASAASAAVQGAAAQALQPMAQAASASVGVPPVIAVATATLSVVGASSTGAAAVSGAATAMLSPATGASSAAAAVAASAASTLWAAGQSAAGAVAVAATANARLGFVGHSSANGLIGSNFVVGTQSANLGAWRGAASAERLLQSINFASAPRGQDSILPASRGAGASVILPASRGAGASVIQPGVVRVGEEELT